MTQKFYAIVTNLGAAKIANAAALGTKLNITQMAVGDGGGTLPTPNASQTKLVNEMRRAALNTLSIDATNASQVIAEQVIPETEGGFWIREMGLFDAEGTLIAVCNTPETYKPALQEGSGRTQTVRMLIIVNSTDAITLKIDPAVVLATRQYVDSKVSQAVIEVRQYADDLMAKHIAAADPHKQYAPKDSPLLTGTPKAPTPATGNNSTLLATTAFVQAAIAQLVASSPEALDTLNELAAALGNDPNFATTMTNQLAARALLAGNVNQQFFVKDATLDGHAVNRGQMNVALALKALLNGDPAQAFQMANSGTGSYGVNNDRLNFVLQSYAALAGNQYTPFSVGGATQAAHAVRLDQFQSGNNGNGAWTKFPNGPMWARSNVNLNANGSTTWTFPVTFPGNPGVYITNFNSGNRVWLNGIGPSSVGIYNDGPATNINVFAVW